MIKRVKLYINDNEKAITVSKNLMRELIDNGIEIDEVSPELCISVGGDGAFLRMVKENQFDTDMLFVGINAGTLGFLQEIDVNETKDFVKRLVDDRYKVEKINIQETRVRTENDDMLFNSLNEIVIRNKELLILKTKVFVDNEYLEDFAGDGLLISTSTGSTAYNLSLGGAIIYNTLNTLNITPIAPINNRVYSNFRNSLVVPGDKKITLEPLSLENDLIVQIDGVGHNMKNIHQIETGVSDKEIKCLRMEDFHFIKIVNNKLLNKE